MPKENINSIGGDNFRAEVSWRADPDTGWVQLATVMVGSPYFMSDKDDGGRLPVELTLTRQSKADQPFDGWHVTLDRDGLNRLIRALRKARDAAFGADA